MRKIRLKSKLFHFSVDHNDIFDHKYCIDPGNLFSMLKYQAGKVSTNFAAAKNGKVGSNFSAAKNGQVSSNSKKR